MSVKWKDIKLEISEDDSNIEPVTNNDNFQGVDVKDLVEENTIDSQPFKLERSEASSGFATMLVDTKLELLQEEIHIKDEVASDYLTKINSSDDCAICGMAFVNKSCVHAHLTHLRHPTKLIECTVFNKIFTPKVKKQTKTHTRVKPLDCKICNKTFSQTKYLKNHLRIHSGEKPFECKICNKQFTQSGHLKSHIVTHSGDKPFECKICNKTFTQAGSLKNHLRIHSGEKPFKCKICNKTFTQISNVKLHLMTHCEEKPFECKTCKKKFVNSYNLKAHLITHSGKKPFKCKICNKTFKQSGSLKNHLRTHSGKKPFQCKICNRQFTQNGSLKRHMIVGYCESTSQYDSTNASHSVNLTP